MGQPAPSKVRLNEKVTFPWRRRSTGLILLLILSLAAGLRLVHLSQVPSGLHQDEAANAWNAWWELDSRLRAEYSWQGCIFGPERKCSDDYGCIGCVEAQAPSAVAQFATAGSKWGTQD